ARTIRCRGPPRRRPREWHPPSGVVGGPVAQRRRRVTKRPVGTLFSDAENSENRARVACRADAGAVPDPARKGYRGTVLGRVRLHVRAGLVPVRRPWGRHVRLRHPLPLPPPLPPLLPPCPPPS